MSRVSLFSPFLPYQDGEKRCQVVSIVQNFGLPQVYLSCFEFSNIPCVFPKFCSRLDTCDVFFPSADVTVFSKLSPVMEARTMTACFLNLEGKCFPMHLGTGNF